MASPARDRTVPAQAPPGWLASAYRLVGAGPQTSWATELAAGVTTFAAVAWLLFANAALVGRVIPVSTASLVVGAALVAGFGTLAMGLVTRRPLVVAPGLALGAWLATTSGTGEQALGALAAAAAIYLVLALTGVAERALELVPPALRTAAPAGIGALLVWVGLQQAGVLDPGGWALLGDLLSPGPALLGVGLAVTIAMRRLRVPGALLAGVVVTAAAANLTGAPVFNGGGPIGSADIVLLESAPEWPSLVLGLPALALGTVDAVLTLLLLVGLGTTGVLLGLDARPQARSAFAVDALSVLCGAVLGCGAASLRPESAVAVRAGARTAIPALVVGLGFLCAVWAWPVLGFLPPVAAAPALVVVGVGMVLDGMRADDARLPTLVMAVVTPLTLSVALGLGAALAAWVGQRVLAGEGRTVHPALWLALVVALAIVVLRVPGL